MVEITTATVASAAERIAADSYIWGQTSTGPIAERRFLATDFLTKNGSSQYNILGDAGFSLYKSGSDPVFLLDTNDYIYYARSTNVFSFNIAGASKVNIDTNGLNSAGSLLVTVATGSIGYSTGAGGAVTQATSRTTAVTLNKPCGAITLVSAAGSASWQSFTVNNSLVAATDVIKVCQKSGTDKYMIHVTAVAAGSFVITFATTGGTTTEQPVFNFVIERAVAA